MSDANSMVGRGLRSDLACPAPHAHGAAELLDGRWSDAHAQILGRMRSAREVEMIQLMGTIRRRLLVRRAAIRFKNCRHSTNDR
jgi:hypothetical protein